MEIWSSYENGKGVCMDPFLIYLWEYILHGCYVDVMIHHVCEFYFIENSWLILFSQLGRWMTIDDLVISSYNFWTLSWYIDKYRLGNYIFYLHLFLIYLIGIWIYYVMMKTYGSMLCDTFDYVAFISFIYLSQWLHTCHSFWAKWCYVM